MNKVIKINQDNPTYESNWNFNIYFEGGIIHCLRGHSKFGFNFSVKYDDTCWAEHPTDVCAYFFNNFILPYLKDNKLITVDAESLYWPTKLVNDHFGIIKKQITNNLTFYSLSGIV